MAVGESKSLRLGALAAAILGAGGFVAALTAVFLVTSNPETGMPGGVWPEEARLLLWGGGIAMALAILVNLAGIVRYVAGPKGRVLLNVAAMIVLALGLLVAVNWLGSRRYVRADWTRGQLYALSEQTKLVLDGLEEPIEIVSFFPRDTQNYSRIRDLLDRYESYAPRRVKVTLVNPDFDREKAEMLAKRHGVNHLNTAVVMRGDRKHIVEEKDLVEYEGGGMFGRGGRVKAFLGEQAFTSAIRSVIEEGETKVYFLTGHDERQIRNPDRAGYTQLVETLQTQNMTVDEVSLLEGGDVPEDCDVLVIAFPKRDMLQSELDAIDRYLEGGGSLLGLLDPVLEREGESVDAPFRYRKIGIETLLEKWNVKLVDRVVHDRSIVMFNSGFYDVIATNLSFQDAPQSLRNAKISLSVCRPLEAAATRDDLYAMPLVQTTDRAWGVAALDRFLNSGPSDFDKKGPFVLALRVGPPPEYLKDPTRPQPPRPPTHPARLIVVGDSEIGQNSNIGELDNRTFLVACMNWLSRHDKLVGIPPREPEDFRLTLGRLEASFFQLFALEGLPLLVVLGGFAVWWFRRQ